MEFVEASNLKINDVPILNSDLGYRTELFIVQHDMGTHVILSMDRYLELLEIEKLYGCNTISQSISDARFCNETIEEHFKRLFGREREGI